jgi:hypothetical protein
MALEPEAALPPPPLPPPQAARTSAMADAASARLMEYWFFFNGFSLSISRANLNLLQMKRGGRACVLS